MTRWWRAVGLVACLALAAALAAGPTSAQEPAALVHQGGWNPGDAYVQAVAVVDTDGDGVDEVLATTGWGTSSGGMYGPDGTQLRLWRLRSDDPWTGVSNGSVESWAQSGEGETIGRAGLATGDLDDDGDVDAAVPSGFGVDVFLNDAGVFRRDRTLGVADTWDSPIGTGDVDEDGRTDLVTATSYDVWGWRQRDQGLVRMASPLLQLSGRPEVMLVEDLNRDGRDDILVTSYADGIKFRLQGRSGTWLEPRTMAPPEEIDGMRMSLQVNGAAVGDVDADGFDDLVGTYGGNLPEAVLLVYSGGPKGPVAPPRIYRTPVDIPDTVAIADMNGDALNDVAVLHAGWGALGIYHQNDSGGLDEEQIHQAYTLNGTHQQGLSLADLNRDGLRDVVYGGNEFGVGVMTSTGTPPPLETRLTGDHPELIPKGASITFTFAGTDARSSFECSLDDAAWAPCTSPYTVVPRAALAHTFRVRAGVDDRVDPTPATAAFGTTAADLALRLRTARITDGIGGRVRVVAGVQNSGPQAADAVRLRVDLLRGLTVARLADGCRWWRSQERVTCRVDSVGAGQTWRRSLILRFTARRPALRASATTTTWDPDPGDTVRYRRLRLR